MEEKIVFDPSTKILKSNINFNRYRDLYSRINSVLSYATEKMDNPEDIRLLIIRCFSYYDIPWDFRIRYTKRNEEWRLRNFIAIHSHIASDNIALQKNGQIMVEKLKQHIENCIERQLSFHTDHFDSACHLLMILENLLHVLTDRVTRFRNVIDEIRDVMFDDASSANDACKITPDNIDMYWLRKEIAQFYYLSNEFTEALKQYLFLYQHKDQSLILEIGDCQLHLDRINEALQSYQQGIESGLSEGYLHIGDYYRQLGQTDEAMKSYQKAIDAGVTKGYLSISEYYESIGNEENAKVWEKKWRDSLNL